MRLDGGSLEIPDRFPLQWYGVGELGKGQMLCKIHGECFHFQWPRGYLVAAQMFVGFIRENEELWTDAGGQWEKASDLLAIRPVCDRITPEQLLAVYHECEVGDWGLCCVCNKLGHGTPYRHRQHNGMVLIKKHVCFTCVVYQSRPNPEIEI